MEWHHNTIDELPSEDGDYLVVIQYGNKYTIDFCSFSKNLYSVNKIDFNPLRHNRPGFYSYTSAIGFYERRNVLYWMHKPSLPAELLEK